MRVSKRFLTLALLFLVLVLAATAAAQLGNLISPGPLTKAHARLEGAANCQRCHEQGRRVSAARCLECHKPIAERIARKKGVHRNAGSDCVACHVEHAGRDAELRPFETKNFDHRTETGFPIDGRHATLTCAQCHKTRSYLGLTPSCASCHKDPHNGRLGTDCARCHATSAPFRETLQKFDHSGTAFPLEGAHRNVPCAKCHAGGKYTGLPHASCSDCHRNPHKSKVGNDCRSCHTPASWKVPAFDHAKTGTALAGRHQAVPCARCHVRPAIEVRLKLQPCAACHKDPHRGSFKQDCAACHNENGFKGAAFDHKAKTRFALEGKHRPLACAACHKRATGAAADFRGLSVQCASCHEDPHKGQLGVTCENCHTPESFRISEYRHPRFPEFFGGQHARLKCEQCHRGPVSSRVYRNLSIECATCHRDVHQGQFPKCADCHSIDAPKFAPVRFDHAKTAFPLTGKHQAVACAACHKSEAGVVRYRGTPSACAACHKDPHLGQLEASCERCHTPASFKVESYTHRDPGAFFLGKHATAQCSECHKRVERAFPAGRGTAIRFTGLGMTCASCHADPHGGQLGTACANCHRVDATWSNASRAFHKAGLFPLEGRHLATPCADCHQNGVVKGTPTRCYDCHWVRRQDDRYRTKLGNECEQCHRPTAWSAVSWDHAARTSFALSGAHKTLACDQCHRGNFGSVRSDCASCHSGDFSNAKAPDHRAAGFPEVCQLCHLPSDPSWHQAHFNHTTFTLAGAHLSQPCAACHGNGVYRGAPRDCLGCHRNDYDRSTSPAHAAAGFGTTCETCHRFSDMRWSDAHYEHVVWPLLGRHATANCSSCHASGVYRGRPTDCLSCHRSDYDRAANPNHAGAGFPLTCDSCHRIADSSWNQGRFSHETFPLAGAHATQLCATCHKNGVYAGTPRTCNGCHQADYNGAKEPNHIAAGFSTTCDSCHKFSDPTWKQAVFVHSTFPLAGTHATQVCTACHKNNVYAGTPRTCVGCHQADYNGAKEPNHPAAGFPTTCDTCHKFSDTTWKGAVFAHSTFPLAGTHATQVCSACHKNNVYAGTPRTCSGCHQADYNGAKEPNHIGAGFPTTCDTCHKFTDATWKDAVFAHNTFPLAGTHATQVCSACHKNNVYAGTPRTCIGCHQADYNGAKEPNHIAAGFPTSCDTCHKFSDATWKGAVFAHNTFPLAGTHATQVCSACHKNGVYAGTPRTCVGCHQADYNGAKEPNHLTAGFPTTCDTCHKFSDATWAQGVFNHVTFPLAGTHATQACSACHKNGVYAGTPRTCVGCHQADYNATRNPNHVSAGFPTTCETCHRFSDTSWTQGVFTHATFPLAGVHATRPCSACHINGVYAGTPRTCVGCHQADYNAARDPNHISAGFPTTCETCHRFSDTSWGQGVFNHIWFPIASGRHSGNPCSACHINSSAFQTFSCTTNCHGRSETDSHHREVSGYRYDSLACYACHPQGRAD